MTSGRWTSCLNSLDSLERSRECWTYRIALFAHILGAAGLSAALAFEWLAVARLRRATGDEIVIWLGVRSLVMRIGPLAMAAILVPGLFMNASRWSLIGWPGAALLGMLAMVVIGLALPRRTTNAVAAIGSGHASPHSPESPEELVDAACTRGRHRWADGVQT